MNAIPVLAAILLSAASAPPPPPPAANLETVKLSDRAVVVRAGGNNVVALASEAGLVVVDTGASPALGVAVRATVERTFGRSDFRYAVNTHAHWDHVWGNQAFRDTTIVAHRNAPAHMRRTAREARDAADAPPPDRSKLPPPPPRGRSLNAVPGVEPMLAGGEGQVMPADRRRAVSELELTEPAITFRDRLRIDLGDMTLELIYYGAGHTDSDILVHVPEESLLATGDLFWKGQLPPLAGAGRIDPDRWLVALDLVLEDGRVSRLVPGHGALLDGAELRANRDYIANAWDTVRRVRREGGGLERALAESGPANRFPLLASPDIPAGERDGLHRGNVEALWNAAGG